MILFDLAINIIWPLHKNVDFQIIKHEPKHKRLGMTVFMNWTNLSAFLRPDVMCVRYIMIIIKLVWE